MSKGTIAAIIAAALALAGSLFAFDFKGAVCGNPDVKSESPAK